MPIVRSFLCAGVLAVLAGCATAPQPQSDAEYKQSMLEAQKTLESQGTNQAVAQFEAIAERNPTRGEPWSYIAKIRFDEQRYGEAIVAADETLSRDPQDFTAKSVRAVGGLRVAMQSLANLREDALLAGNARPDAIALAAAMRETLGQDVLFPDGRRSRGSRAPARPRSPTAAEATPATTPPAAASPIPAPSSAPATAPTPAAPTAKPTPAPSATPTPPAAPAGRAPDPFGNLLKP